MDKAKKGAVLPKKGRVVWWDVFLPTGDPESPIKIEVAYRIYERAELSRIMRESIEKGIASRGMDADDRLAAVVDQLDEEAVQEATARLMERVADWRGVIDEDGAEVEFSKEGLAAAIEYFDWFRAIDQGLFSASQGAVRKN